MNAYQYKEKDKLSEITKWETEELQNVSTKLSL